MRYGGLESRLAVDPLRQGLQKYALNRPAQRSDNGLHLAIVPALVAEHDPGARAHGSGPGAVAAVAELRENAIPHQRLQLLDLIRRKILAIAPDLAPPHLVGAGVIAVDQLHAALTEGAAGLEL